MTLPTLAPNMKVRLKTRAQIKPKGMPIDPGLCTDMYSILGTVVTLDHPCTTHDWWKIREGCWTIVPEWIEVDPYKALANALRESGII